MKPVSLLRQYAADLAFEPDGSFWFANGRGAYSHAWDGLGHFDLATGKITILEAPVTGPIAIVGELLAAHKDRQIFLVDRAGTVKRSFAPLPDDGFDDLEHLTASSDGRWIAAVCRSHVFVLDAVKGTRVGKPIVASGAMFTPDQELVYVQSGEPDQLVVRSLARRTQSMRALTGEIGPLAGVLERRGRWWLDRHGRIVNDKTGRYRDLGAPYASCTWANEPEQIVRAGRRGIDIITTSGEVVRTITRPHRTDVIMGKTVGNWFTCTTGTAIERYDLTSSELPTSRTPRKAPTREKRPPTVSHDDATAKQLLAAYWKHPDDKAALRVWADLLIQQGDPRGEFILLSLVERMTPEQAQRYTVLARKKGEMAGPARDFLRRWRFQDGLVVSATCEARQLLLGFENIRWLNPILSLTVNALKRSMVTDLANLDLGAIHSLRLEGDAIDDARFELVAPALAGVQELFLESRHLTVASVPALAALDGIVDLTLADELVTRSVRAKITALIPSLVGLNGKDVRKRKQPRIWNV